MYETLEDIVAATLKRRSPVRRQRINFRASDSEERLIRMGAERRGEKVTQFIVESACAAAEMVLAVQKHFELSPAQFERFERALDRPAKVIPALQKLFREETVLDRSRQTAARGSGTAQIRA
jgi:uncharacterized protein (DUF1778 family)